MSISGWSLLPIYRLKPEFFSTGALRAPGKPLHTRQPKHPPQHPTLAWPHPRSTPFRYPSGNKSWLRRRLHAAIVREYLDGAMADEGE